MKYYVNKKYLHMNNHVGWWFMKEDVCLIKEEGGHVYYHQINREGVYAGCMKLSSFLKILDYKCYVEFSPIPELKEYLDTRLLEKNDD